MWIINLFAQHLFERESVPLESIFDPSRSVAEMQGFKVSTHAQIMNGLRNLAASPLASSLE